MGVRNYAGHIFVLAAVVLVSCQKTPDRADGGAAATADSSAGARSEIEIPSNTALWIQLEKALDSSKLKLGEHFTGTLAEAIVLGGKDAVPKGATVKGHVTNKQTAQSQGTSGLLSLELDSLSVRGTDYHVTASPLTLEAAPLQGDPGNAGRATPAVQNAYAPKKGILQFILTEALRVKS